MTTLKSTAGRSHKIRIAYRYLSGRPLDGLARTDATYLHAGTRALTVTGRASRWAMLPGWKRQAWRVGTPTVFSAAAWAYATHPALTTASAGTLAGVATVRGVQVGRRRVRGRRFRQVYTRPLVRVVAPLVGLNPHANPDRWLTVSPDLAGLAPRLAVPMSPAEVWLRQRYGAHVEPVLRWLPDRIMRARWAAGRRIAPAFRWTSVFRRPRVELGSRVEMRIPETYITEEMKKAIRKAVSDKLGLWDLVESWDQVGDTATGRWTIRERPPETCTLADIYDAILACKEDEVCVGITRGGRPWTISLSLDSPHIACSAGSGAGKSVLAMLIAIQILMHGGRVIILDLKGSHRWALGLPGVTYCTQPEDMHSALIGIDDLASTRNQEAIIQPEGWDPGQRVFVIFEEMNATVAKLKSFWASVREKSDPKFSPAIEAFRNITYMGRSAKVNLFGVAQMLTANTTGGPESRENFGVRCLARFTVNAWKMLVPECAIPRRSKTPGRWQVVVAGEATEVQVAYVQNGEARELLARVPMSPDSGGPGLIRDSIGDIAPGDSIGDTVSDPLAVPMTLREAVETGIIAGTYAAAKKRLQRAGEAAPQPVGKQGRASMYRCGDLVEWSETIAAKSE